MTFFAEIGEEKDTTGFKRSSLLLFETCMCKHVSIHTCLYFPFVGTTCETSGTEDKSQKLGQFTSPVFKRHSSTVCGGAMLLCYSISFSDDRTLGSEFWRTAPLTPFQVAEEGKLQRDNRVTFKQAPESQVPQTCPSEPWEPNQPLFVA